MVVVRVAVVGAGPAGIYAAAALAAHDRPDRMLRVDVFDRLPTPYGLVRYGTAPDHLRIKEVVLALRQAMASPAVRFFGNVSYGTDLDLTDLRRHYHAVIFATGARNDRAFDVPGAELPGCHGGADFVAWYNGHPDATRDWSLTATQVAVIGAGNVALDIARMLAKPVQEQRRTEIADNVERGLALNRTTDVHLFIRRGPADVKFTALELRELAESPSIDLIVHPEGAELDAGEEELIAKSRLRRTVVRTLLEWRDRTPRGAARRIHFHFRSAPVAVLGSDRVSGLRVERTRLAEDRSTIGTGVFTDHPVQAVYRAIGYRSDPVPGVDFDKINNVVPQQGGRVSPGIYVTGWVKRGPVGLIGHTRSDAAETVATLLADLDHETAKPGAEPSWPATITDPDELLRTLADRGVDYTTLAEWDRLDQHEISLGVGSGRQRIKVVARDAMITAGRVS